MTNVSAKLIKLFIDWLWPYFFIILCIELWPQDPLNILQMVFLMLFHAAIRAFSVNNNVLLEIILPHVSEWTWFLIGLIVFLQGLNNLRLSALLEHNGDCSWINPSHSLFSQ